MSDDGGAERGTDREMPISSRDGVSSRDSMRGSRPWHRVALLSSPLALLLILAACTEPSPSPISIGEAYGRIVGDDLYVVPSADWRLTEAGEWEFYSRGQFVVHVAKQPRRSLRIELSVAPDSRDYRPSVRWEGTLLPNQRSRFSDRFVITLPAEKLTTGTHRLSIERDYKWDSVNSPNSQLTTHFTEVRYGTGWTSRSRVAWDPLRMQRYRYLREFFASGVTGSGRELFGGVLFDGPGRLQLTAERAGTLEMVVENLSSGPIALNLASLDSGPPKTPREVVPAEGKHRLRLAVANGAEVELSVAESDGLTLFGGLYLSSEPSDPPPSIVLITLDTTRRDFVAPYDADAATPNLAEFASAATVFEQAVATSPWTLPSHGSMFTGLWPSQHGGGLRYAALPFELTTLAEHLREAGYYTAGFAGGFLAHHQFGLGQGMMRYRDPDSFETRGGQLTAHVEGFLEETPSRPLFLFVNYFDPHALYQAPAEFRDTFEVESLGAKLSDRPIWGAIVAGDNSALSAAIKGEGGFDHEVRAYLEAAYRAELSYVDSELGRLFATLKADGLWDDAMVVVVGDHGELLGERDLFTHAHRLDPELISIPLLIKWPGQVEAKHIEDLVSQVDLFPTLLAVAGVRPSQGGASGRTEGQEGLPLHFDDTLVTSRRERAYFEEHESAPHPLLPGMRLAGDLYGFQEGGIRWMAWDDEVVCHAFEDGAWQRIDCPPGEWNAATIGQAVGADAAGAADRGSEDPSNLSDEDREALEALGYL